MPPSKRGASGESSWRKAVHGQNSPQVWLEAGPKAKFIVFRNNQNPSPTSRDRRKAGFAEETSGYQAVGQDWVGGEPPRL